MRFIKDEPNQIENFNEISEKIESRTDFFKEELDEEAFDFEEYERKQEEKLISSLSEASLMNRAYDVDLKEYFSSILAFLINDIRFSYRKFYLSSKNEIFNGFKDKYLVINLLILAIINEIEYKNPIKLSTLLENNILSITYELKVEHKDAGLEELQASNQRVYSKIGYAMSLISSEKADFNLDINSNTLKAIFKIYETKQEKNFSCHASLDGYAYDILKEYLNIIFY